MLALETMRESDDTHVIDHIVLPRTTYELDRALHGLHALRARHNFVHETEIFENTPLISFQNAPSGSLANQGHTLYQNCNSSIAGITGENLVLSLIIDYFMQQGSTRMHTPANGGYIGN